VIQAYGMPDLVRHHLVDAERIRQSTKANLPGVSYIKMDIAGSASAIDRREKAVGQRAIGTVEAVPSYC
jgi:hypothetical protein